MSYDPESPDAIGREKGNAPLTYQYTSNPRTLATGGPAPEKPRPGLTYAEYQEAYGGPTYFVEAEPTNSDTKIIQRYQWVPDEETSYTAEERATMIAQGLDPDEGGGGGEWKFVYDPVATALFYGDEAGPGDAAKKSGAGSGAAYVKTDPDKDAMSAFDRYMSRVNDFTKLRQSESDQVMQGARYNMDLQKFSKDFGSEGYPIYVQPPPELIQSNNFQRYFDDGLHDPDYVEDFYAPPGAIRGYAAGTMMMPPPPMADPLADIPENIRSMIGKGSIPVPPPIVDGYVIPAGTIEPSMRGGR